MSLEQRIRAELSSHYVTKSGSQSRYRCPWRAGSDGQTLAVNYDTGEWYDYKDNTGGKLPSLARRLGLNIGTDKPQSEETLRTYKNLEEYATMQGAPVEIFKEAWVSEGTHQNRPALCFPMKSPDKKVQKQYRFLDGKKPKWIGQRGFKRCWYGLNDMARLGTTFAEHPLVICNGAASVLVAQHHGVPAVAIPGGENANIPDDLIQQLREWIGDDPAPPMLVAMDCDAKGRKVGREMANNLREAGFDAKAVDLGLGNKGDLAQFCKLHGEFSIGELEKLPPVTEKLDDELLPVQGIDPAKLIANGKTWLMIHAKDRHEIPPVEWVIPGEIPRRGLTVIYGTSGVGKSFFIIDRALKIAQDKPVIYAALEGESGVPSRIDAWCKHYQKEEGELILCLGEVNFFDDAESNLWIEGAKAIQPHMVIVDTLARAMGEGDENSTRDMNKLMSLCKRIYTALGCAVVLVHHTGKDGQQERGSYSLRGAADSMIQLVDDDEFIQVECTKTKDAKPFQTYFMTLKPIDVGVIDATGKRLETPVIVLGDPNRSDELNELTIKQRKVLQVMAMDIFEHGCSVAEIAETAHNMDRKGVNKVVSRLKKLGYVHQEAPREPYKLADKARLALNLPPIAPNAPNAPVVQDGFNTHPSNKKDDGTKGAKGAKGANNPLFDEREMAQAVDPVHYGYGGKQ